jgi:D-beta-D-heptose 7-phosphate kinase/D-beta-D-heptose 1-phosphate adenosyltransferase
VNFDLLIQLKSVRVLVIGDLMLDHYIWGDAHRISPEAPVPVVHVTKDTYTAGGAANVALNLANLGVETTLLGYFSMDEAGSRLSDILSSQGIKLLPSEPIDNAPTIIKTRVLVRNQQLCRIDREAGRESYCINQDEDFFQQLHKVLMDVNAVVISDYAKGVINQRLLDEIFSAAKMREIFIAVDPKPSRKLLFKGANLLTPNRSEAMELAGIGNQGHSENYPLAEICRKIDELYAPKLLVITLGADGMAICQEGKVIEILPTEAREVFDVSGAGDTVIATLTAALAAGANPHEAARLANAAAGCVVGHMGTAPIRLSELKSRVQDEG